MRKLLHHLLLEEKSPQEVGGRLLRKKIAQRGGEITNDIVDDMANLRLIKVGGKRVVPNPNAYVNSREVVNKLKSEVGPKKNPSGTRAERRINQEKSGVRRASLPKKGGAVGQVNASTEYSGISLHEMLLETTRDEHGNKIGSAEDRAALAKAILARRAEKGVKYKKNAEGKNHVVLGASGDEKTAETPAALVAAAAARAVTPPPPDNETPEDRSKRLGAGRDAVSKFVDAGDPNRETSKGGAGKVLSVDNVFSGFASNLLRGKAKKAKAGAVNASTEYRGSSLHEMLLEKSESEQRMTAAMLAGEQAKRNGVPIEKAFDEFGKEVTRAGMKAGVEQRQPSGGTRVRGSKGGNVPKGNDEPLPARIPNIVKGIPKEPRKNNKD